MPASAALTFRKEERICSKKLTEQLFHGGRSRSMASFPLRMVYLQQERKEGGEPVQLLISVPKRCLRHAVDRNRVKRIVREAYRQHRHLLTDILDGHPQTAVALALIWLDNHVADYALVEKRVRTLLLCVGEKLQEKVDTPI